MCTIYAVTFTNMQEENDTIEKQIITGLDWILLKQLKLMFWRTNQNALKIRK